MRKQVYLITFLALFLVMLGTVAAADVTNDNTTLTTSDATTADNSDVIVTSETPNADNSISDSSSLLHICKYR